MRGFNNIMRFNNKIFHISLSIVLFLILYIYYNNNLDYANNATINRPTVTTPESLEYVYSEESISFSPNYYETTNTCIDSTLEYNL